MLGSIYESYGVWPFIIAFLIIVIIFQRGRNRELNKRADDLQKRYAESETERKSTKEKTEKANKDVERHVMKLMDEHKSQLTRERREHDDKLAKLIDTHNTYTSKLKEENNNAISLLKESYGSEIDELHKQIEKQDAIISEQNQKIELEKNAVVGLKSQVQEKDQIIAEQDKDIKSISEKHYDEARLLKATIQEKERTINDLLSRFEKRNSEFEKMLGSNLKAMPYLAGMISDYLTYDLEVLANQLDWGHSIKRYETEVKIRELRRETKEKLEKAKQAEYQLAYLIELYPELEEIIETEYKDLIYVKPSVEELLSSKDESEVDSVRQYLTNEEWRSLSEAERNQKALDRYVEGRTKSNWQVGRDYELYVGYSLYEKNGWEVRYYGSEKKLEDLGRDLIARKGLVVEIVQCKYWGKEKTIHEKHVFQLYGTKVCYEMEHETDNIAVNAVFITNTVLSAKAKEVAERLGIRIIEEYPIGLFPRIKCNIGKDQSGKTTKIYHMPMDQQYDNVIIDKEKGEMLVTTVKEAESAGFRRAYKWHEK